MRVLALPTFNVGKPSTRTPPWTGYQAKGFSPG